HHLVVLVDRPPVLAQERPDVVKEIHAELPVIRSVWHLREEEIMRHVRVGLLAVAILFLAVGCGTKAVHSTTPAVTSPAASTSASTTHGVITHGNFHYPPVVVRNYMHSCVGTGGTKKKEYCDFTVDKL